MAIRFWEIYEETQEKYKLRILAGKNGMDNVTGWVHMLEDETIINRFSGEELAVTTGMKAGNEGWLLRLVSSMKNAESTGIIINTGMYLKQIPEEVIDWCEAHDFPLLEMPWEISITDLIQDYCMRIMSQMHKERQEALLFERLLRGKEVPEDFLEDIGNRYNLDGTFRIFCLLPKYTAEEKVLFRQSVLKLENVFGLWQNGSKIRFPYFLIEVNDLYILAINDFPEEKAEELICQMKSIFSSFFERKQLSLGIGPACWGIHNLKQALGRARIAVQMSRQMGRPIVDFNQMGVFGILFSTEDPDILRSYADRLLGPLEEYDKIHYSDQGEGIGYVETLRSYIINDRSLIGVARSTYTHRNTVNYRIQNIKRLLNNELKTSADLFPYQIALCIRDMKL